MESDKFQIIKTEFNESTKIKVEPESDNEFAEKTANLHLKNEQDQIEWDNEPLKIELRREDANELSIGKNFKTEETHIDQREKREIRRESGRQPRSRYLCDKCNKRFIAEYIRDLHVKFFCEREPCEINETPIHQEVKIKSQIKTQTTKKRFECKVCGNKFTQKNNLERHQRDKHDASGIYINSKKFACDICKKKFATAGSRHQHMKIHTGAKPFSCGTCRRAFLSKAGLKMHIKTHTGEKPYGCNICGRDYVQKIQLKRHMTVHNGEKWYKCGICNAGFATKQRLNEHTKTKHHVFKKEKPAEPHFVEVKMEQEEYHVSRVARKSKQNMQTMSGHKEENVFIKTEPEEF